MSLEINSAIARACHEVNRSYCLALGDLSQASWEDAPDWQRESARVGVIRAIEGATPEQLHESWLSHKQADGWIYGTTKDAEKRVHPCMVPYGELPPEQRAKDHLFSSTVKAMKAAFDAAFGV
jgi:hypothetical protein